MVPVSASKASLAGIALIPRSRASITTIIAGEGTNGEICHAEHEQQIRHPIAGGFAGQDETKRCVCKVSALDQILPVSVIA